MHIQDCITFVKIGSNNRIQLPKALGIAPDLEFTLFKGSEDDTKLFLIPTPVIAGFLRKHKRVNLHALIKQDKRGRIAIPPHLMRYFPATKKLSLYSYKDHIQIFEDNS